MEFLKRAFQDEKSKSYHIFNDILAVIIVISVVVVILESVNVFELAYHSLFTALEIIFVSVFTVEYILRIALAERKLRYIFSAFGIIDLLAILPSFLFFAAPFFFDFRSLRVLRVLRVLRLLRLFRILKLLSYTHRKRRKEASEILKSIPWYNIEIYLFSLFSVITISGTLIYLAEYKIAGTLFTSIPQGLWWAVVTITTVGYGDMVPVSVFGKIVAALTMISGLTLFALLITVMGRTVQTAIFGSPLDEEIALASRQKKSKNLR